MVFKTMWKSSSRQVRTCRGLLAVVLETGICDWIPMENISSETTSLL